VAQDIGAKKYFECSAKSGEGVEDIFMYAAKMALKGRKRSKGAKSCKFI
jgi:Ras homolog gene family, member A